MLLALCQEIDDLLIQPAARGAQQGWRFIATRWQQLSAVVVRINFRAKVALRITLFFPLVYLVLAMTLSRDSALKAIPMIALIPILATAWLTTQWPLAVGAIMAVPSLVGDNRLGTFLSLGRRGIRFLWEFNAVSLMGTIIFVMIPIQNDLTLTPLLFVSIIALLLPIPMKNKKVGLLKGMVLTIAIVITAVLFLGDRGGFHRELRGLSEAVSAAGAYRGKSVPFRQSRSVCKDLTAYNFVTDKVNEVDVFLKGGIGGCLGQEITLPASFTAGFHASVIPAPDNGPIAFAAFCPDRGRVSVFYGPGATPGETLEHCDNPAVHGPLPSFIAGGHGIAIFRRNDRPGAGSSQ